MVPGNATAARPGERGGELDLAVARRLADRLGRVLDQVQGDLDELVAIGENRRQRRIIILDKADMTARSPIVRAIHIVQPT